MTKKKRILFFVTEDWYFCSHRLPVARAALAAGMQVTIVTRIGHHADAIKAEGFDLIPVHLSRAGLNPFSELRLLCSLIRIYRQVKPDLVHQVAMKPVIYGSFAALLAHTSGIINAMAGLGFVFSSRSLKARILRPLVRLLFKILFSRKNCRLIVQNKDDVELFSREKLIAPSSIRLILGSGVNEHLFNVQKEPEGIPVVTLPARLLHDKGVIEFVAAAHLLKNKGIQARFVLVGEPDKENPASISDDLIIKWRNEGIVEYWGWQTDLVQVLAQTTIVCLPSYREGLPKSLLEAASCAKPIVTTDVPGCREVVEHGVNGLLVPPRTTEPLAAAIEALLASPQKRQEMGRAGRQRVLERYAESTVVKQTLDVYRELLEAST